MVKIRKAKSEDINFVYSTWLRCYKHDSPITKYTKRDLFFGEHQKLLDHILTKKETTVVVAVDENDEDLIFGFLAYEPKIIHFCYVKEPFRKMGIARQLIESQELKLSECQASHVTYTLLDLWTHQKVDIQFNPYLLQLEKYEAKSQ